MAAWLGPVSDQPNLGYGTPPEGSRFQKGRSGNPRGRPKNRRRDIPYDGVLGQMVTVREDGRERRVTAAEAFLLQLSQKGLAGDDAAARASLEAIETARMKRGDDTEQLHVIVWKSISFGADTILDVLGLAVLKHPTDEKRVRWEINPWIVEAALARLRDQRLSLEQQRVVWANTRPPEKVAWPDWWQARN